MGPPLAWCRLQARLPPSAFCARCTHNLGSSKAKAVCTRPYDGPPSKVYLKMPFTDWSPSRLQASKTSIRPAYALHVNLLGYLRPSDGSIGSNMLRCCQPACISSGVAGHWCCSRPILPSRKQITYTSMQAGTTRESLGLDCRFLVCILWTVQPTYSTLTVQKATKSHLGAFGWHLYVPALLLVPAAIRCLLACCLTECTAKQSTALGRPSGGPACHSKSLYAVLSSPQERLAPVSGDIRSQP